MSSERVRVVAKVPCWAGAAAAVLRRRAGHVGRLDAHRLANRIARWRDAWRRNSVRAILAGPGDPTHQTLNRRHRGFGPAGEGRPTQAKHP